jgi:hypothetical protein
VTYDQNKINTIQTLKEFVELQPSIKYTIEKETNTIHLLDLTVHCKNNKLNFSIYQKPTQTDMVYHNSYHPIEYKLSSINYLINRLHTQ